MKSTTKTYLIISILVIFGLLNYIFLLNEYSLIVREIILVVFWSLLLGLSILLLKFQKSKKYLSDLAVKMVITSLLATLIIMYGIGFFVGFSKNVLFSNASNFIKLLLSETVIIVSKELIRLIVARNSVYKKHGIILLTIAYIFYELTNINIDISSMEAIFMFVSVTLIPILARESLASYLVYNFNLETNMIYMLVVGLYPYVLPILPVLGDYITSMMLLLLPFSIYLATSKIIRYNNREDIKLKASYRRLLLIPIFIFTLVIAALNLGLFKYKMIAIISNSMIPTYKRGDAIIYDQKVNIDDMEVGEVLVFYKNNMVITHRIISKRLVNGKVVIKTKGDNNTIPDNFSVYEEDILGLAKYVVPNFGFPAVWVSEALQGE